MQKNPFQTPPPFEKLVGDHFRACSRRVNIHHRLVCQIYETKRIVKTYHTPGQSYKTRAFQSKNQQKGKNSYYFIINLGILRRYPKIFKLLSDNRK